MESAFELSKWKRVVIKVGSALIAPGGQGVLTRHLLPIARFINECREMGKEVILVSSGAVAAGMCLLSSEQGTRRRTIPEKQALAAIGQSHLMATWNKLFDYPCAQVLLTHDDLRNRKRFVNAKNTLNKLLELKTLPIINENDTVAVDELKVGDNDNLAAHVAVLADADLLLILSDVSGLYTANPRTDPDAKLICEVHNIDDSIRALAGGSHNALATGGMTTKIEAAEKAGSRGINTIIAAGFRRETFEALALNRNPGTLFHRTSDPIAARKHWLRHVPPIMGRVLVDEGAAQAMCARGASLLPSGICKVEGIFHRGDVVEIARDVEGTIHVLARGIAQYNSEQINRIKGHKSGEIGSVLGFTYTDVFVHRGDMAVEEAVSGKKINV